MPLRRACCEACKHQRSTKAGALQLPNDICNEILCQRRTMTPPMLVMWFRILRMLSLNCISSSVFSFTCHKGSAVSRMPGGGYGNRCPTWSAIAREMMFGTAQDTHPPSLHVLLEGVEDAVVGCQQCCNGPVHATHAPVNENIDPSAKWPQCTHFIRHRTTSSMCSRQPSSADNA
jgi:hypothetical protein